TAETKVETKLGRRSPIVDRQPEPDEAEPPGEPGPDLRLLSVLFCDMVESTGLSARFSAEEMHDLIGAYQDTVATAVQRYGGYVAKFLGDGVLAYFGWPMAYEDHAESAIRAGLAAIAGVGTLKTPAGAPLQSRAAEWLSAISREGECSTAARLRVRRPISLPDSRASRNPARS